MFGIATADIIFGVKDCLAAFAFYQGPGGAQAYIDRFQNWKILKTALFFAQTVIGDGVLVSIGIYNIVACDLVR